MGTRKAQACVILLLNIRGNPRFYHHSTQIILFSYCDNKPLFTKILDTQSTLFLLTTDPLPRPIQCLLILRPPLLIGYRDCEGNRYPEYYSLGQCSTFWSPDLESFSLQRFIYIRVVSFYNVYFQGRHLCLQFYNYSNRFDTLCQVIGKCN